MIAQGLLVEGQKGEDYLLTTEPNLGTRVHRLVVQKKVNGRWKRVDGIQESACREALIGAFVDFFVDLCRVLNTQGPEPVTEVIPFRSSLARRPRAAQPTVLSREKN